MTCWVSANLFRIFNTFLAIRKVINIWIIGTKLLRLSHVFKMVLAKHLLEHVGLIILILNCIWWIFKINLLFQIDNFHMWWSLLPFLNLASHLSDHPLFNQILPIRSMILLNPSRLSHRHHLWHATNIHFFLSHNIRFSNRQNCRQFLRNQGHPS